MPRPCGHCKKVGHGRKDCPDRLEAQAKKKREAKGEPKPAKKPKRARRTKGKRAAALAVSPNGAVDNAAKATAVKLLEQLQAVRARLDAKITHVEELVEIL